MDLAVIRLLKYLNLIINYRGCRKCEVTDDSWIILDYTYKTIGNFGILLDILQVITVPRNKYIFLAHMSQM